MKLRAYLLMFFVIAIWGSTFAINKAALTNATPLAYNLVRMAVATVVLALAYHRHLRELHLRDVFAGAIVGIFLAIGYDFQTVGLTLTTPSKNAFLTGLVVILVPLLSVIPGLGQQNYRLRWNILSGAFAAFLGILLLTTNRGSGIFPDLSAINHGDLLSIACALGFALHCLTLGRASRRIGFQALAVMQIGFCTLFMALGMPLLEHPHIYWTPFVLMAVAITALLATALAFAAQSWAQSILPPTHMAVLFTMEPVFAWLTSFLFLGERLGLRQCIGAMLILTGIALTELVPQRHPATDHEA